jgi:aspartyl-tRNA(Asn)/glutamyl-tRNA(Gln) amidotransferase subunit A
MFQSYQESRRALLNGDTSAVSITQHFLTEIKSKSELNAFLEVFEVDALAQAKEVDIAITNGEVKLLSGMVIGLKDNICYKDHKIGASSKILEGFESLYSATVTERLLNQGAIIIGRLNCDEFAMGSSNENSAYGPVKNALNTNKVPGGSSGGSATAVAGGLCHVTLGSDTGGSIRQPASFTGTVGLKPTYGRVSRHGLLAYGSSFDQIGPFANNVEDSALVLEVIAGKDEFDTTASSKEVEKYTALETKKPAYKIAYLEECLSSEGMNDEAKANFKKVIEDLKAKGHTLESVSFPYLDYMVPTYYVLTTAEASSNLSRYDGVHYGHQSKEAQGVEEVYKMSRAEGFGPEVKRRIMAGTFVLSNEFYDAYYTKGQKVRRVLQDKTNEIFKDYDFVLTPTTPDVAFDLNAVSDPISMYLQDIFTVHANLTGNPAISIPKGEKSDGMPFGIQLMADHFEESELLAFSAEIEKL